MRHKSGYKKFNRNTAHRVAMITNMAVSLLEHGHMTTTLPKAKALRPIVERIISRASRFSAEAADQGLSLRRLLLSRLNNRVALVARMLQEFPKVYANRPGGYTRIYKCGYRKGDCAPMALIKLVDLENGCRASV